MTAVLPHLGDHELKEAEKELLSLVRGTTAAMTAAKEGVVAFKLGNVYAVPMKHQLARSELEHLDKVLHADAPATWLTRVCSGTFAHVYKFKRHTGPTHNSNPNSVFII